MSEKKDDERPSKRAKTETKTTNDIAPMSFVLGNRALPMRVANYILENFVYMSELTFCRLARNALQKYPRLLVDGRHLELANTRFVAQEMSRLQPHLQYVQYLHSVVPEGDECKLLTTLPRLKKLEVLLPAFAYSNRSEKLQKLDTFWRAFFPLQTRSLQEFVLDVQVIAEDAHLHTNRSALKTEQLVQKIIAQQKVQPDVDIQTLSLSTVGYRFTSAQDLLNLSEVLTGLRHVKLGVAWNQNANVLNMFDSLEQLETLQLESLEIDDIKNVFVRDVWIPTLDRFFLRHSKTLQRLALHRVRSRFSTFTESKFDVFCDPSDQTLNVFQSYAVLLDNDEALRFLQTGVLKSAVRRFPNKKLKQVSVLCRQDVANCLEVLSNAELTMQQLTIDGQWQRGRKRQIDPMFNPLINPDQLSRIWKHLQLQILTIANFGLVVNTTTNGIDWPIDDYNTFPFVLSQTAAFCATDETQMLPLVDFVLEAKCKHLVSTTERIDFFERLRQSKHAKQLLTVLSAVDQTPTWAFANRTRNNVVLDPIPVESYSVMQQYLASCSNVQTLDLARLGPIVGDRLCQEIQPNLGQLRHLFLHCSFNTNILSCLEQLDKAHQQWEQVYFEVHPDSKEAKFVWIEHQELERFLDNQPHLVGFGVYFHYFELPVWSPEELEKFKRGLSFQHKHPKLEKLLVHIWDEIVMVDELWGLFVKFPNLKQLTIVRRPVMGLWDSYVVASFGESERQFIGESERTLIGYNDYVALIPHWPAQLTSFDMCFSNPEDSRISRSFERSIRFEYLYYNQAQGFPTSSFFIRAVVKSANHRIGLAFRNVQQKQQFLAQPVSSQLESKSSSQASPFELVQDHVESLESNEHARTRYNFLTDNLPFQHTLKIPVANQASTAVQRFLSEL